MDNYYSLFKGGSKKRTSKRSSNMRRVSRNGINFSLGTIKVLITIFMILVASFIVLLLFSRSIVYETANESNIDEYLTKITESSRYAGTDNEITIAKYINEKMTSFGYDSKLDGFEILPYDGKTFARNVVAVKEVNAEINTNDTIILAAHFDSELGSVGANNNASGIAALLELANVLKDEKTDTKIIFLFLSATYENERGARYFLNTYGNEKNNIIGVINVDSIGIDTKPMFKIVTSDLKHISISSIMDDYAKKILKNSLDITYSASGIHTIFTSQDIPAITFSSSANSMYDGLSLDTKDKINTKNIKKVVDILENTMREVIKLSTESYLEKSRENNTYDDEIFIMTKDAEIPFGGDKASVEEKMQFKGVFGGTDSNENNDVIDSYLYNMKWFDLDTVFKTKFIYKNKGLEYIKIEYGTLGISTHDILKYIKDYLQQEYKTESLNDEDNVERKVYKFEDLTGRKLYTIEESSENAVITVSNYYTEDTVYSSEDLFLAVNDKSKTEKEKKLIDLISKILMPRDVKRVSKYITFTDGIGYKKGYLKPEDAMLDNSSFTFAIDIDDVYDKNGNYRNYKETIEVIIKNYAYILALNDTQVELSEKDTKDKIYLFDKGEYLETSYLKIYRNNFHQIVKKYTTSIEKQKDENLEDAGSTSVQTKTIYAYENAISGEEIIEEFANNFAKFILEKREDTLKKNDSKVVFFYNFEELVNIREYIRNNLEL